jgi:hypothetical protein
MIPVPDTITTDAFCRKFGLTNRESLLDTNWEWVSDSAAESANGIHSDTDSEEWQNAYDSASESLWKGIDRGYESAMKKVGEYLSDLGIKVIFDFDGDSVRFDSPDWNEAAEIVIESINGYGMFHFDSVEDLILCGPYAGAKEACLAHIHWHSDRGDVFGEPGIKRIFDSALEHAFRYM